MLAVVILIMLKDCGIFHHLFIIKQSGYYCVSCSCVASFTDFWEAYKSVFISKRHKDSSKKEIEHLNNTLHKYISHFFRKTLSFSNEIKTFYFGLNLVAPMCIFFKSA